MLDTSGHLQTGRGCPWILYMLLLGVRHNLCKSASRALSHDAAWSGTCFPGPTAGSKDGLEADPTLIKNPDDKMTSYHVHTGTRGFPIYLDQCPGEDV